MINIFSVSRHLLLSLSSLLSTLDILSLSVSEPEPETERCAGTPMLAGGELIPHWLVTSYEDHSQCNKSHQSPLSGPPTPTTTTTASMSPPHHWDCTVHCTPLYTFHESCLKNIQDFSPDSWSSANGSNLNWAVSLRTFPGKKKQIITQHTKLWLNPILMIQTLTFSWNSKRWTGLFSSPPI